MNLRNKQDFAKLFLSSRASWAGVCPTLFLAFLSAPSCNSKGPSAADNNMASVKLWRKLGYTQLSVIPKVAVLEGSEGYVDAYQFHYDFYADEAANT